MKRGQLLWFVLTPLLYVLITLGTGFVTIYATAGGVEYGLPLPWKTVKLIPTCNGCPLPTTYDWIFFILDVMFYNSIGLGIVFLRKKVVKQA